MPVGRIILKSISDSKKLSLIKTDGARLLYTWLIPHLDVNGCYSGDAEVINGKVLTRLKKSDKTIEGYLQDLEENKLIIRYEINGDIFLNVPDFIEKQPSLYPEREGKTTIPLPTQELVKSKSGVTPLKGKVNKGKVNKGKVRRDELTFNFSTNKFENLLKTDTDDWKILYDRVDIEREILKMIDWLKTHQDEKRSHKKNWRKFITNWLSRTQKDLTEGIKNKEIIEKMLKNIGSKTEVLEDPGLFEAAKNCYIEMGKKCNVAYNKKLNAKCIICLQRRGSFNA